MFAGVMSIAAVVSRLISMTVVRTPAARPH
jgi:hypothetical protein